MCKISIVIPIYNGEKTIERCLKSLCRQELRDIEILVVDDGSTDNSVALVQAYMEKDERIRLLSQKNKGQGAARNLGIKSAKGKYIGFVDCDDFVTPKMFQIMTDALEKTGASVAVCQEKNVYMKNDSLHFINETKFAIKEAQIFSNIEVLKWQLNYTYMILNCVWNKVYDKRIFEEYDIYFPEEHRHVEDMVLSAGVLSSIEDVVVIPQSLYYYVHTKGSSSYSYTLKHAKDIYSDWEDILGYIRKNGIDINTDNFSLGLYFAALKQIYWMNNKQEKKSSQAKKIIAKWEIIRKEQRWKPDFSTGEVPFLHKIKILVAYFHLCKPIFKIVKLLQWIPYFKYMI